MSVLPKLLLAAAASAAAAMSTSKAPIAVIGSTGKLGRLAVQQLVAKGYRARCLVRHDPSGADPSGASDATGPQVAAWLAAMPGVELVRGDVTDEQSVAQVIDGCSACLAMHGAGRTRQLSDLWQDATLDPGHAKQVNFEGVRNVLKAAQASGSCKRVVRITGKGETPWSVPSILINGLGCMAKAWNYEGENLLRGCADVDYTIIRPGVMNDETEVPPRSLALADDGGDLKVSPIARKAIAELAVESLDCANAARTTLCAMGVPAGEGADSFAQLLLTVNPDRRAFRDDLFQEHERAVRLGGTAIAAALVGVLAAAVKLLSMLVAALFGLF